MVIVAVAHTVASVVVFSSFMKKVVIEIAKAMSNLMNMLHIYVYKLFFVKIDNVDYKIVSG